VTVLRTDRLADTDLHIKSLAYEMDALLGTGFVFATYSGSLTISGGLITVPFPLSTVLGAVIQGNNSKVYGDPQYANPVPPASIGATFPLVQYAVFINALLGNGNVQCGVRTVPVQITTGSAQTPVGWGSRPVTGAVSVNGVAWGRA
jgi:hypothetical protein